MKKKVLILLMCSVFFGFYGVALGGGGGLEDPACLCLPVAKTGPVITGPFTVAIDKSDCSILNPLVCAHYDVHATLKKGNIIHVYSFPTNIEPGKGLCAYTAEEIKEAYERVPCSLGVAQDFGYTGLVPAISEIMINNKDFCNDAWKAMISGDMVIRLEPPVACP